MGGCTAGAKSWIDCDSTCPHSSLFTKWGWDRTSFGTDSETHGPYHVDYSQFICVLRCSPNSVLQVPTLVKAWYTTVLYSRTALHCTALDQDVVPSQCDIAEDSLCQD
eukprot:m.165100 g.165100  ORF g.165100 m.165100 type:complete len:108 (+) comp23978_c0_seq2:1415-1738(+)